MLAGFGSLGAMVACATIAIRVAIGNRFCDDPAPRAARLKAIGVVFRVARLLLFQSLRRLLPKPDRV